MNLDTVSFLIKYLILFCCDSYGDLSPRSAIARTVSMVWFLTGLILNGIIIGFITTAMTSFGQPEEIKIYNTKVCSYVSDASITCCFDLVAFSFCFFFCVFTFPFDIFSYTSNLFSFLFFFMFLYEGIII